MNKQRRNNIRAIQLKLAELVEALEEIREEEQEAYNNLPESLQESERGEAMYAAIDNLESAVMSLEEVDGYLEEAKA